MKLDLRALALLLSASFVGCQCGPLGLDQKRFACTSDDDCLDGFVCRDVGSGRECVSKSAPAAGGAAGGAIGGGSTSGGLAGGGSSAGGNAAGGSTSGGTAGGDAGGAGGGIGGGDAGGDAGGSAGGATAGGTTAGGTTAGGTAGGSGGGTAGGRAGGAAGGSAGGGAGAGGGGAGTGGGGAGAGGGAAGGASGGGSAVGPPTQLVFTNSPRTQPVYTCSFSLTVEARDAQGRPAPVSAPTVVTFATNATTTLHTASNCTSTPITTVTIPAGSSSATVVGRGTTASMFQLVATASGLTPASQVFTVTDGPDTIVFTNAPPSPLRAGQCFALTYQTRKGTVTTPVGATTTITFGTTPNGAARYYADPSCTAPSTSQLLASGASTDTVFVRVLTGGSAVVLQASGALFTPATVTVNATPMVRRGACVMGPQVVTPLDGGLPDGGSVDAGFMVTQTLSASCPITPALTSAGATMLFTQTSTANTFSDAEARCRISGSNVSCVRRAGVTATTVQWQAVEIVTGLRVMAVGSASCGSPITLPSGGVDPNKSFLLKTLSNDTQLYDDEDATVFSLTSPTSVTLSNTACAGYELQAVEWQGLTVTRGAFDGGFGPAVTDLVSSGLPPASTQRALLTQATTAVNGDINTCAMMARGAPLVSPSEVRMARAYLDAGCAAMPLGVAEYERLDFGTLATVQERTLSLTPGQLSASSMITAVDLSRTFVFSSAQSSFGQGMGETNVPDSGVPLEAAFTFDFSGSTAITVRRTNGAGAATITFYVVQVE
ncbi:MAG: hypothetical protein GQE15_17340 [Archangiaceae bacterium]|nr:hypothetical protein [Archangiaceae bacterium]